MGSNGTIPLKKIWSMLDVCAPGHVRKETTHYWRITYEGRVYPNFPLGPHGRRKNPRIEVGHIKKMANHLGIRDCASRILGI